MKREEKTIREMAAALCSVCATDALSTDQFVFMAPRAYALFDGLDLYLLEEALALAGSAWAWVSFDQSKSDDWSDNALTTSELYAECEALIREGWSPSDD